MFGLKLAKWLWRRRFLKVVNVFHIVAFTSSVETECPIWVFTQEWIVRVTFGWNWRSSGSREDFKSRQFNFTSWLSSLF